MKAEESKNSLCLSSRFSRRLKEREVAVLLQEQPSSCRSRYSLSLQPKGRPTHRRDEDSPSPSASQRSQDPPAEVCRLLLLQLLGLLPLHSSSLLLILQLLYQDQQPTGGGRRLKRRMDKGDGGDQN